MIQRMNTTQTKPMADGTNTAKTTSTTMRNAQLGDRFLISGSYPVMARV